MRTWAGLGLGALGVVAWIGCGGSESSSTSSSGGTTDSGPETSATDTGAADTSKPVDAAFDGFIDAPEVTLTFGTCPEFQACGGDEKGSWKVTGGCLSDSILAAAKVNCPGLTTSNETITAKGIVELDGTNVLRRTSVTLKAKAFIPLSCAPQGTTNCGLIGFGAQAQLGFDKAACVDSDGGAGCDCDIEDTTLENSTGTYTKSGNTITTDSGDTFDYCVSGGKLTYTQTNTTGNQPPPPLYIELAK